MPKRSVTMSRNGVPVTTTEMTGHDAEIRGHVEPKYAADLFQRSIECLKACLSRSRHGY